MVLHSNWHNTVKRPLLMGKAHLGCGTDYNHYKSYVFLISIQDSEYELILQAKQTGFTRVKHATV